MARARTEAVSARDHYAGIYAAELEAEAQWLRYGACDKVDSIERLLGRNGIVPDRVLELGCGTGAVIGECRRRNLGQQFTAVDYSAEAIAYLVANSSGITCIQADINDPSVELPDEFDVVILSHVLEHLDDPATFLASLRQRVRFRYLVAEVPLEDLFFSRVKSRFRDRLQNAAGHVQFYTARSFHKLLRQADFRMVDSFEYAPVVSPEAIAFVCRKDGLSQGRAFAKKLLNSYMPRAFQPLWRRYYYANAAALCTLTAGQ